MLPRSADSPLSDDENEDEGLYNELKAWKPASGSKVRAGYMQMQLQLEQQDKASKQLWLQLKILSPRNNNIRITFKRKDLMQVTLVETHVTLLSSTKGVVEEELMK